MGEGLRDVALMVAAGIGIPVLAALNTALGHRIGSANAAAVVLFAVALAAALAVLVATGEGRALGRVAGQPPVLLLAGCLVAFYILSITHVTPRFGLARAIQCVLLGQLVSAALIDATGFAGLASRPISGERMLGLGLMAAGVLLSQRG
ncbi:MAG: DMT family transporter [Tabrizicola flagellatus]|uniref:DMT family transporter n=1 Tax=Tabrizicola flagellatus TaxID=2593021 RepID=UPI00391C3468